jgi:Transposase DDE domain
MKSISCTLSEVVSKHIDVSGTRLETLVCLIGLFVRFGSVCLWRLAAHAGDDVQTGSHRRRFYRFFQFVTLDQGAVVRLVLSVLGVGNRPVVLVMDRTNWQFGKIEINILMVCVVWQGIGIPLIWTLLPHAGNSSTQVRQDLLGRLLNAAPDLKIAHLIGDREFIGEAWMAWCKGRGIPFILRLRENQRITRTGHAPCSLSFLARSIGRGERLIVRGSCLLGADDQGVPVRIALMRLPSNEILALACSGHPHKALALYRERWQIEMLFGNLKTRGFNLEDTHLTNPKKLQLLLALLAIATAWIAAAARKAIAQKPLPTNKKGKTQSIFAIGIQYIRHQWNKIINHKSLININLYSRV